MKSSIKDIVRTIRKERKRFLAMAIIAVLGITMFSGLVASCDDIRVTADNFFDAQNLHDIYIQSTLGLTQDDVDEIAALEGVEQASGFYSEEVQTSVDNVNKIALIKVINPDNMDQPYILSGSLPSAADEIAVTRKYIDESGRQIGDTVTFVETDLENDSEAEDSDAEHSDAEDPDAKDSDSEDSEDSEDDDDDYSIDPSEYEVEEKEETPTFANTTFTIVGVVIDAADINAAQGSTSFRDTSNSDYTWFVTPEAADTEIYTGIGVTISGLKEQFCYSNAYDTRVHEVTNHIADTLKLKREQARTQEVRDEANELIDDAEQDMLEAFDEAEEKFSDAWTELEDGEAELADAQKELDDGRREGEEEIADARKKINDGYSEIKKAEKKLSDSEKELDKAEKEIKKNEQLLDAKEPELNTAKDQLTTAKANLKIQEQQLEGEWESFRASKPYMDPAQAEAYEAQLNQASAKLEEAKSTLSAQERTLEAGIREWEQGKAQLKEAKKKIENGRKEIKKGREEIAANREKLNSNKKKLDEEESKMYAEIEDGQKEIDDGRQELDDGYLEYEENWDKYQEQKLDAEEKIADARQEVEDLEEAKWYLQNRYSLSGYNNVKNDMSAIESLGLVFAVIFLVVAVLICLTTVTRMVEEDRGLIGTYQALGYYNREIRRKYMCFALSACLLGCAIGEVTAFVGLPKILEVIFAVMYQLPPMVLTINWTYFFTGPLIFMFCITLAVFTTCRTALNHMPATLMRPKAPAIGSRVFLEYIPFLWTRISFLNKVTARNLFRYKKRFFMTVFGIAGCMGILICGFGIKDTVVDLMTRQYDVITHYSWMVVVDPDDKKDLDADLAAEPSVLSSISLQIESVSLINDAGETMIMPLYVLPDGTDFSPYISLEDIRTGEMPALTDEGILVTRNAGTMLQFEPGDTLTIQDLQFYTNQYTVTAITENYLGNAIFMTRSLFDRTFGDFEENACLVILNESGQTFIQTEAVKDMIQSSVSTEELKNEFSTSFALINMVVYIIIFMAAALAFVVLFTLSTTNISERERELATIKVLGFYNREVHLYVNKETLILTVIGIIGGVPLGIFLLFALTNLLKMPELYFAASIHRVTYWISAALSFLFAILVNQLTNRTLNAIDPVEALKSIE